ncbi:MAG: hypothetical protein J6L90_04310 [Clostridia bacterium]|nr:hypothetical protein [Clostridia bacterium]
MKNKATVKMTYTEVYEKIAQVIGEALSDMPRGSDGEPLFTYQTRVYFSNDKLEESDGYIGRDTSTVWGEISFEAKGGEINDESLCFSLALDLDKSGMLLERHTVLADETARFLSDIRDTLYTPARACENVDELVALIKKRQDEEAQKIIDEFEQMTKKIYRKALIIAIIALVIVVPLLIYLAGLGV